MKTNLCTGPDTFVIHNSWYASAFLSNWTRRASGNSGGIDDGEEPGSKAIPDRTCFVAAQNSGHVENDSYCRHRDESDDYRRVYRIEKSSMMKKSGID